MDSVRNIGIILPICVFFMSGINGHPVNDIDIDEYLTKYNYLGYKVPDPRIAELAESNMTMAREVALSMYQMKWGLRVTGVADADTLALMRQPRCGMPDIVRMRDMPDMSELMETHAHIGNYMGSTELEEYQLQGSKWPRNDLTYKIIRYCSDLSRAEVDDTIARAFQVWADVTPLTFTAVSYFETADIVIQFKDIYDPTYDFDGPYGALAYAYYPQYGGDAHFDDAELWTIDSYQGTNLLQTAAHEFGHSLGLHHSNDYTALMYPYLIRYNPDFTLPYDDMYGIQSIYGSKQHPITDEPPTPTQPPTHSPNAPEICNDPTFDAVTTQKINGNVVTLVFRSGTYYALDTNGLLPGYPRYLSDDWRGIYERHIDAALTQPWEKVDGEWKYHSVTYLFSGQHYYKFVERQLQGGVKSIEEDFGLPSDLDAVFQSYADGRVYAIKGHSVYRFSSLHQGYPDEGYPRDLSSINNLLYEVDAALMGADSQTYLFEGTQFVKFEQNSFQIEAGYPKSIAREWLKC